MRRVTQSLVGPGGQKDAGNVFACGVAFCCGWQSERGSMRRLGAAPTSSAKRATRLGATG